jgi:hypothetical protein
MASATAHHAILRLQVSGGFLDGLDLTLVDGLNCIIGGRGTGKTTALEFIRYAFGLMPDPKTSSQRARILEGLIKSNLPANGCISLEVQTKSGTRYKAERRAAERTVITDETGSVVAVSLEQLIGADIFSLNEIEEIAIDPGAQLEILDRFVSAETEPIEQELATLELKVNQTSDQLRRCDRDIEALTPLVAELPLLVERLKEFVEVSGPDAEKINAAHAAKALRDRESQITSQLSAAVRQATDSIAVALSTFRASAALPADPLNGANSDLFKALAENMRTFELSLVEAERSVRGAAAEFDSNLERHRLALEISHTAQDAEYRMLMAAQNEDAERAAKRNALQTRRAEAEQAKTTVDTHAKLRGETLTARSHLLNRMSDLRDRRFELRKKVATDLSAGLPTIRVTVSSGANSQRYTDCLADIIKGTGKYNVNANKVTQSLLPSELVRLVLASDADELAKRTGLDTAKANRIVEALRKDGAVYDLEGIGLEDVPCIELLDGKTYKPSSKLSTGQRCTTILPLLLMQSERPLLVDQPEDNLDNAFIYDAIVTALGAVKGKRQILFVTHNPNIPVLGEAERVFVMSSDGQQGAANKVGTVDDCKAEIETLLEGGRDAFIQRKNRYGH